jgi:Arc/MetJ-type ribon-helix-helix transcriptional regulator
VITGLDSEAKFHWLSTVYSSSGAVSKLISDGSTNKIYFLTASNSLWYGEHMEYQKNTKIQSAIAHHMSTGKYASAEEVVLAALKRLDEDEKEYLTSLTDLRESLADEEAGRLKPLQTVAAELRKEHGFNDPG